MDVFCVLVEKKDDGDLTLFVVKEKKIDSWL
jgi:hypothetical protein